jgi:hypothetical protein
MLKAEDELLENIVLLKDSNPEMQNIYPWLEEFSNFKQLNEESKMLDSLHRTPRKTTTTFQSLSFQFTKKEIKNDYYSNKMYIDNKINLIDFGDDLLFTIENNTFNIFDLEEFVGKENILTVIGTYIFMEQGLYSCVHYQFYENFLKELSKGYIRDNPYHTDLHAADVAQTCYVFIKYGNIKEVELLF